MRLDEIIHNSSFGLKLLVEHHSLHKPVRWVHTAEVLDPSPFLSGEELILSDGCWHTDAQSSRSFVRALVSSKAAALGIAPALPDEPIPEDIVDACRDAGLTLFQVPWDLPFISISEFFVASLTREREAQLMSQHRGRGAMLSAVVGGGGLEALLVALGGELSLKAWVVDDDKLVHCTASDRPSSEEVDAVWLSLASSGSRPRKVELSANRWVHVFPVPSIDDTSTPEAVLACSSPSRTLTCEQDTLIEDATKLLTIQISRANPERRLREALASELVGLALEGEFRLGETHARLRSLGFDPEQPLGVLAVGAVDSNRGAPFRHRVSLAARSFGKSLEGKMLLADLPDETIVIIAGGLALEGSVQRLVEYLLGVFQSGVNDDSGCIGVGQIADDATGLQRSIVSALHACRLALRERGSARVRSYQDLCSYQYVVDTMDRLLADAFEKSSLGCLDEYDRDHGTHLVATLESFLANGGHPYPTARNLYVHVNTLRQRIDTIERLTGRSLRSTGDRTNLFLALEIRRRRASGYIQRPLASA